MLVRPTGTKPAANMRCTTDACAAAGGASASTREPAGVASPAMSNRSFRADRNAGVAAWLAAGATQHVHRIGHRACLLGVHLDERARALAVWIGDAGEALFHQCAAGRTAIGQGFGMVFDRAHDAASVPMGGCTMSDKPAKPVLLTGASGALGRVLTKSLSAEGWTLRLTDIAPFPDAVPAGASFTRADLNDGVMILRLAEGCGAIVHLGGVSVERPFEEVLGPNIRGLYHIYEAARREKARVIFASSNHSIGYPRTCGDDRRRHAIPA